MATLTRQSRQRLHQAWRWPRRAPAAQSGTAPCSVLSPLAWARQNATLVHPVHGLVPFEPYWYQASYLESYQEHRRFVLKARQIGFSQVFAIEALYTAIHEEQSTVLLVSRNQSLAANMLRYCYVAYTGLREPPPLRKRNQSEIELSNGSRILSLPANPSAGRGYAATIVYLDEFAYAAYDEEIYQSISPALAQGGRLVVGSTPNGRGNLFAQLYQQQSGFVYFVHPWHHCPRYYTPSDADAGVSLNEAQWYQRERPNYTAQQWAAEFDCDFVVSGLAVFDVTSVDAAHDPAASIVPQEGRRYLTSVDVGRRQDATVINVFDATATPVRRVHHRYVPGGSANYPLIAQSIAEVWRRYGGPLVVESNGVGDPLLEFLTVPAEPFVTSVRSKTQAIQALQLLLENRQIRAAWTEQERRELALYQWDDRSLQQDCVMSLAIGAYHLQMGRETHIAPRANRVRISQW